MTAPIMMPTKTAGPKGESCGLSMGPDGSEELGGSVGVPVEIGNLLLVAGGNEVAVRTRSEDEVEGCRFWSS